SRSTTSASRLRYEKKTSPAMGTSSAETRGRHAPHRPIWSTAWSVRRCPRHLTEQPRPPAPCRPSALAGGRRQGLDPGCWSTRHANREVLIGAPLEVVAVTKSLANVEESGGGASGSEWIHACWPEWDLRDRAARPRPGPGGRGAPSDLSPDRDA